MSCVGIRVRVALIVATAVTIATAGSALDAGTPPPCDVTLTSPLAVSLSGQLADIVIDDSCQHIYTTNKSGNQVAVFSLQTGKLETPIAVGSLPAGLDLSPDGATIYVANSGGNNISVVDTAQEAEAQKIPVPTGFLNDTPFSVAVSNTGVVFFSTTFSGSGFGGRLLQLDPATSVVSQRTDFWFYGTNTELTLLRASADRSTIGIVAGDISSGPVFKYSAATDVFSKEKDLNTFVDDVALDATGTTLVVDPGTFVLDSTLSLAGTIVGGGRGVAVDRAGTIGYRVRDGKIDVLDLTTFLATGSLAIGDTVNTTSYGFGVGRLAISRDGSLLSVITDHGFSIVSTNSTVPQPSATRTPSQPCPCVPRPTITPTPTATATPHRAPETFNSGARLCQATLASVARTYSTAEQRLMQKCFDRILKDVAARRGTSASARTCDRLLNPDRIDSALSRTREEAESAIRVHCKDVSPEEIDSPCLDTAVSISETGACVLRESARNVERTIAATYQNACGLLDAVGLTAAFSGVCGP